MKKDKNLERITEIASTNQKLLDRVILYINSELNITLYKDFHKEITMGSYKENFLLKPLAFYRNIIIRILESLERYKLRIDLAWSECQNGERLLKAKQAATVQSPNYGSEVGKQENGYHANTQEKKLLEIEEEIKKQNERLVKYQALVEELEDKRNFLKDFILLAPNSTGGELLVRHYFKGEKYSLICDKILFISENYVQRLRERTITELAKLIMVCL